MRVEGEQLHCADGPAVHWPGGAQYFFWRGLPVPADLIQHPETITVATILGEPNTELRRVRMERYGEARFLVDAGAAVVSRDDCGVLYQLPLDGDEPLTMVKVINSTPEPDGHVKEYFLRVPPTMTTAKAAVAWSFDLKPSTYAPAVET